MSWEAEEVVTDSAGVTVRYTPIEDLRPGDVVILGWRTTVGEVECDGDRCRVRWEDGGWDQWNPVGSPMPRELSGEARDGATDADL